MFNSNHIIETLNLCLIIIWVFSNFVMTRSRTAEMILCGTQEDFKYLPRCAEGVFSLFSIGET